MRRSVSVYLGLLAGVALLAGWGSTTREPPASPVTSIPAGLLHTGGAGAGGRGAPRHSSLARTRGGKRPARRARSMSHSGWA